MKYGVSATSTAWVKLVAIPRFSGYWLYSIRESASAKARQSVGVGSAEALS